MISVVGCNVKNEEEIIPVNMESDDSEFDVNASNSLGNYISRKVKNDVESHNDNGNYSVSELTFDPDTGTVSVKTSQTNECEVSIRFLTDDGSGEILKTEASVNGGNDVLTQLEIETTFLPQYYQITAELLDPMGMKISNTYVCNEFTRNMQEIYAADIYDFNQEYVVNLDDNDDTNFMVLSEKTVIAEASEAVNNLVSADYENGVYVFDNIDETIKGLQKDEYFFVQVNETDMIAISVASVDIKDGSATITENTDDADDMFDFIKIEERADESDAVIDTSSLDEGVVLLGNDDGESIEAIDLFRSGMKTAAINPDSLVPEIPAPKGIAVGGDVKAGLGPVSFEVGFQNDDKSLSVNGKVSVGIDANLNFYKKKDYCSVKLVVESPISAEVTVTEKTVSSSKPTEATSSTSTTNQETSLAKWSISLGAFANLVLEPKFCFEASVSTSFTVKYTNTPKYGFNYDTINGRSEISEKGVDNDNIKITGKIEGSAFIGMKFEPALEDKLGGKILKVSISAKAGIQVKASMSIETTIIDGTSSTVTNVLGAFDDSGDSIHSCGFCIDGDINFIFNASVTVALLPEVKKLKLEFTTKIVDVSIKLGDFYYSSDIEFGWGTCPNVKCRTEFCLTEQNGGQETPIQNAEVKISDVSVETNSEGKAAFYCSNGTFKFEIYIDNEKVDDGTFVIYNAKKTYNIKFDVTTNSVGGKSYNVSSGKIEAETTTVTTPVVTTTTTTTTEKFVKDELAIIESGQLGEEIYYLLYGDGFMYIYGSGEMDDFSSCPIVNPDKVKEVSIENFDDGEGITNIGGLVFSGCVNMSSIEIPDSVTSIDSYVFYDCDGLTSINIPNSVTAIENNAFSSCNSPTSIEIPTSVKTIGNSAFSGCTSLKTAVINGGTESIGTNIFSGCTSLEELTLPYASTNKSYTDGSGGYDKDSQIGDLFYRYNSYYGYAHDYTERLADYAIRKITITGGECIPAHAFSGMTMLTEIVLPETVTYIGDYAFYNCDADYT